MAVKAKAEPKTQTSQKSPYPGVSKAKRHYAETKAPQPGAPRSHRAMEVDTEMDPAPAGGSGKRHVEKDTEDTGRNKKRS